MMIKQQELRFDALHPIPAPSRPKRRLLIQAGCASSICSPATIAGGTSAQKAVGEGDTLWRAGKAVSASYQLVPDHVDCGRILEFEGDLQVKTWNKTCEEGELAEDVGALALLVQRGCFVSNSTFYGVLKRCIAHEDLVLGTRVHALAVRSGHASETFMANHIIRMYAAHGKLEEATRVFTNVSVPDRFMWASIILAHAKRGQPTEAIKLYQQMCESNVRPDNHVFVAVLKACATAEDLASGKKIHDDISRTGEPNIFVWNSLVDMYSKCGNLEDARRVFDNLSTRDVVTWNAMIAGYAHHGYGQEALDLYSIMQQEGTIAANRVTFVCLLQACASTGDLHQGQQLHGEIRKRGLESDVVVGNCLVDLYAKCGSVEDARRVFDNLQRKTVVTWTSMIAGYAQHGLGQDALNLYARMQQEGSTSADAVTFLCLLKACASIGALHQGRQLHAQIQERGLHSDIVIGNCLVDMYAKCGSLKEAREVFANLPVRNVVSWNALLFGYAEHTSGRKAIQCFEEMRQQGVEPNDTTFICLLVACSHAGLVHEGQQYFNLMKDYDITPTVNHYNCIVDLLGRSGYFDEAENTLRTMPFEGDAVGWTSLLTACKSHGDVDRARRCFNHLVELEPQNAGAYVLLSNIYAKAGRWRDVDHLEDLRKSAGAWKKPAKACIEVNKQVHQFTVGEETSGVSAKLRNTNLRLREGGHLPQTELVLKAVSQHEKEDALCGHAEKLALAFGLLNTPDGTTLLVTKNLRMCNDCHSSTKIMSRLEEREIIVRDAHRVHHFVDGSCSCSDRP